MELFEEIHESWSFLKNNEKLKLQLKQINDNLVKIINENATVLPCPYSLTFDCFNYCHADQLKVVILGQDPYFSNKDEAMGLSFSVPENVKLPPTLKNIFKELKSDLPDGDDLTCGDLTPWAEDGVLLLNTSLTVLHKTAGSHVTLWKNWTEEVLRLISQNTNHVVFILWGAHARAYKRYIDTTKHHIIESVHPSPLSANSGDFFGSRPFSRTNEYLVNNGRESVNWKGGNPTPPLEPPAA